MIENVQVIAIARMVESMDLGFEEIGDICTTNAALFGQIRDRATDEQIARRIAACWNICAGVSTEELEQSLRRYGSEISRQDEEVEAVF